tara:strand:+ start:1470 stop:2399 length:930 start_codon:yes stop_codon:yes gene_type:complete
MKVLVKAMKPHRQRIFADGNEMKLQQFANRKVAEQMRAAGQDPTGEGFQSARDTMMRDAVANPEKHSIKFMGERVPFEGQTLGSSLSEPDVAGEQAAIDAEFGNSPEEQQVFDHMMNLKPEEQEVLQRNRGESPQNELGSTGRRSYTNKVRDTRSADSYKTGDIHPKLDDGDPKVQQWQSSKDPSETPPKTAQDKLMSEIMDETGNLKPDNKFMDDGEDEDDMPPPEEEDDRPKSEDELLERIMAQKAVSHIRGFRDAWSVLKNEQEPEFCDNCNDPYRCSCPSKREMNERIIQENGRFVGERGTLPVR